MSKTRRSHLLLRLAGIAACLLAGAAITVGVSWWIAARGKLHQFTGQYVDRQATQADLPGPLRGRWPDISQVVLMPGVQPGYRMVGIESVARGAPGDNEGHRVCTLWSSQFGWPMHAMEYLQLNHFGGNESLSRAIALFDEKFPTGGVLQMPEGLRGLVTSGSILLPGRIIAPGFIVNTLLYGGLLWSIVQVPGVLRRRMWRKAGRCAGCGYEVGTLARCPECGKKHRPRTLVVRPG